MGETPLIKFASEIDGHCLNYFHSHGRGTNPRLEAFELLINAGADVHTRDLKGRTVLHALTSPLASPTMAYGQWEAMRLALEKGAEVDAMDVDGRTAMDTVLLRKPLLPYQTGLIQLLTDFGARRREPSGERGSSSHEEVTASRVS